MKTNIVYIILLIYLLHVHDYNISLYYNGSSKDEIQSAWNISLIVVLAIPTETWVWCITICLVERYACHWTESDKFGQPFRKLYMSTFLQLLFQFLLRERRQRCIILYRSCKIYLQIYLLLINLPKQIQ